MWAREKNPLTQACRLEMRREGFGHPSIPGHTSFPLVKTFSVLLATDLVKKKNIHIFHTLKEDFTAFS